MLHLLVLGAATLTAANSNPQQSNPAADKVFIDASAPIAPPETGYLHLGATSSTGHSLQVNRRYLVLDGKPWLPVMGEFHFSRYPASEWEDEILKMQAGGVNIVSTYVFWIHHEEVEGQFDWNGQRDLRHFVKLCAKHHMYVWLRIGPWAHGEVRNGGFPDWVQKLPNTRTNDPTYIHFTARFYNQIGLQVHGLMFKDGGPILGVQLENEYGLHGPGRGAEHILKLKQLAIAAGMDAPLFSVTGWPSLDFPPREVIPVSGGYPDGFWYGSQTRLPPSMTYLFNFNRELGDMGATVRSADPTGTVDLAHDPYFAAEEGGGMASAYHRRPVLSADDIAALTLTGIGSGINLYGYYMFHGGANPKGKLTTLQESTATGYPNDLPVVTYDFGAPLGEFGQQRESFRKTRLLHLFLNAYGSELAAMPAFAPAQRTRNAANTSIPRVAVRTDGTSGFLFVNNYVRQLAMPARLGFQVHVKLPDSSIAVPARPIDIPANTYFAWPFHLALGHARLRYSTAQLLTRLDTPEGKTPEGKLIVFFAVPGIAAEFSFDSSTIRDLSAPGANITASNGSTFVTDLIPGTNTTIKLNDPAGSPITILVLTRQQAEDAALFHIGGASRLVLSTSTLLFDGRAIHLRSTTSPTQTLEVFGDLNLAGGEKQREGLWTRYTFTQPAKHPELAITQTRIAAPRNKMHMGPYLAWRKTRVPVVPPDSAFLTAATWQLQWNNPDMSGLSDMLLQIDYTGDIGRLRSAGGLLDDNFFHGLSWQVGLKRSPAPGAPLTLQILSMPRISPIYLDQQARRELSTAPQTAQLLRATLIPEYESVASTPISVANRPGPINRSSGAAPRLLNSPIVRERSRTVTLANSPQSLSPGTRVWAPRLRHEAANPAHAAFAR